MGRPGAAGTVVDADGRVQGVDGLHVADASILPTIPRANTHLTVLAVAEAMAERLVAVTTSPALRTAAGRSPSCRRRSRPRRAPG